MNKSIELTRPQIKALQDGATAFILPVLLPFDDNITKFIFSTQGRIFQAYKDDEYITSVIPPLRKGDADVWIKEEFNTYIPQGKNYETYIVYKADNTESDAKWKPASQMQQHQSRYTLYIESVEVKRVNDLDVYLWTLICGSMPNDQRTITYWFNELMRELNLTIKYEDNPYVFLVSH